MTLADRLERMVDGVPDGCAITIPVTELRAWLTADAPAQVGNVLPTGSMTPTNPWREKLWTCPGDMLLNVPDVAEALDRSPDWVYRAANAKQAQSRGRSPLPCSRLDGVLVFRADAVRRWVRTSALVVNPEPGPSRATKGAA
jgi:hypothetical protein